VSEDLHASNTASLVHIWGVDTRVAVGGGAGGEKKTLAFADYQNLVVQPVIMHSSECRTFSTYWNGNKGTHRFSSTSQGKERQIVRYRLTFTNRNYVASPVDICHIMNRAGVQILITCMFPNDRQ
jgi:hypothetical protein